MTGEAAPALAAMLGRHARLRLLNLSDTALGDEGVAAVMEALHAASTGLEVGLLFTKMAVSARNAQKVGDKSVAAGCLRQPRGALRLLLATGWNQY